VSTDRPFPVLMGYDQRRRFPACPRSVPWSLLAPHEEQALNNHDQSLAKLASRGGLGVSEMLAVIEHRGLRTIGAETAEQVAQLNALVAAHLASQPQGPGDGNG
jgi:hypothetical protein